mmetsp:Transcript_22998/g.74767  ORF Transcript_22998/g.74767 Transcript_22998/m.74767 type:complete len:104 (+) Transcript_22998:533-844(+)
MLLAACEEVAGHRVLVGVYSAVIVGIDEPPYLRYDRCRSAEALEIAAVQGDLAFASPVSGSEHALVRLDVGLPERPPRSPHHLVTPTGGGARARARGRLKRGD